MKEGELRIGNYVFFKIFKEERLVRGVGTNAIWLSSSEMAGPLNIKNFEPIPLTEEWLIKFGFKKLTENNFNDYTQIVYGKSIVVGYENSDEMLVIYLPFKKCEIGVYNPAEDDYAYVLNIDIDHVHQLQNLYYSLTNEKLTIN